MFWLNTHLVFRLFLVFAMGLALGGTGFAHRSSVAADAQMLAYLQTGGTLADLCDEGAPNNHLGRANCEACHLVGAAVIPGAPDWSQGLRLPSVLTCSISQSTTVDACRFDHSHGARAPPVI